MNGKSLFVVLKETSDYTHNHLEDWREIQWCLKLKNNHISGTFAQMKCLLNIFVLKYRLTCVDKKEHLNVTKYFAVTEERKKIQIGYIFQSQK